MGKDILVSVIVTTFNRKESLTETINSILSQTYQNFELIVVDNYSDYDFIGYIQQFCSDKIKAFQNNNNGIIAVNRNYGVSKAKGEYLAFCDDDDIWLPQKLEKQVNCLQEQKVEMVCTPLILFGPGVKKEYVYDNYYKKPHEVFFDNYFTPSTLLVKKSQFVFFNECPEFNCAEDWTMCLELILNGYSFYQMQEPLVKYRIASTNMTSNYKESVHVRAIRILKYLKNKYPNKISTHDYLIGKGYHYMWYCLKGFLRPIRPIYRYIKRTIFKRIF